MKLLIIGDSFSHNNNGWPSMLGVDFKNCSENGVGEYKVLKQIHNADSYDKILVNHTSPWRVHTPNHPVHKHSNDRQHNDFMLTDVEYHSKVNKQMKIVNQYLKKYYDPTYQLNIYNLIVDKLLSIKNAIHITFHDPEDTAKINNNYNELWKTHPGNINHMSPIGNEVVADKIKKLL